MMGRALLLGASLIWGSSFFVMKNSVAQVPVLMLLSFRFTVGFVLLSVIFFKRWKGLQHKTVMHGLACGLAYTAAYLLQTYGLQDTTPGKNAFLTAIYCVLSPFLAWLFYRKKVAGRNWLAAVLCMLGIGLVSLDAELTMGRGDALTLLGGVMFAVHLVFLSGWGESDDPVMMAVIQMGSSAVLCWIGVFATGSFTAAALPASALPELIYLAVFATTIAGLLQNVGQSVTPAAQSAILLSFESVFGVMFSCMVGQDVLTPRLLLGFAVIFASVILGENAFTFRRKERC